MNSDFELFNCVVDRRTFVAALMIDSFWSRDFSGSIDLLRGVVYNSLHTWY